MYTFEEKYTWTFYKEHIKTYLIQMNAALE